MYHAQKTHTSCAHPFPNSSHTVKGAFRIFRHLSGVRKAAGLIGDRAESKMAGSGRLEVLLTVLLLRAARD